MNKHLFRFFLYISKKEDVEDEEQKKSYLTKSKKKKKDITISSGSSEIGRIELYIYIFNFLSKFERNGKKIFYSFFFIYLVITGIPNQLNFEHHLSQVFQILFEHCEYSSMSLPKLNRKKHICKVRYRQSCFFSN
jgi:hypothetical protein